MIYSVESLSKWILSIEIEYLRYSHENVSNFVHIAFMLYLCMKLATAKRSVSFLKPISLACMSIYRICEHFPHCNLDFFSIFLIFNSKPVFY